MAKSGVNGFPWQASIGAAVVDAQFIPNGQHVVVNGRTFTGPLHVVRRAVLKEISFVDSGADANTSAKVAARNPEQEEQKPMKETATAVAETVETQDTQTDTQETPETVSESPTPEQPTSTPTTVNAAATTDGDPVVAMRRQMAAETRRVEAIRKLCRGKHPDIEAQAIEEGWDETKVELHVLRASRPQVPAVVTRPQGNTPQVFEAVAMMASGLPMDRIEALYAEPILEAADRLRGMGIQEFCERACGQQLPLPPRQRLARRPSDTSRCRISSQHRQQDAAGRIQLHRGRLASDLQDRQRQRLQGAQPLPHDGQLQVRAGRPRRGTQARQAG